LLRLAEVTRQRGSDAFGYAIIGARGVRSSHSSLTFDRERFEADLESAYGLPVIVIGNVRAEPTTEWFNGGVDASQMHPFVGGVLDGTAWVVVHNGTIANDRELEAEGYERAYGSPIDSAVLPSLFSRHGVVEGLGKVQGSYAVLAVDLAAPRVLHAALNFKPLYTAFVNHRRWFSSQRSFLVQLGVPWAMTTQPLDQYESYTFGMGSLSEDGWPMLVNALQDYPILPFGDGSALVVCSGGLDSTVAATLAVQRHGAADVTLLHFRYGCRAQSKELASAQAIARALGTRLNVLNVEGLFADIASTSPLLDDSQEIQTEGDRGAEFAYEWVPARNLVFLSMATALAENMGRNFVYVGTNLEESGAYPDNEPEFINRLNHLMPYAVGPNRYVRIEDPCGNLMKHQIVKLGLQLKAPLHLSWSCYYGGERHCGECGPCKMRRTAFRMNHEHDPIEYAAEVS